MPWSWIALAAISFVVVTLGLLLPSSYIGGKPISAPMLAYDQAHGQHFFDAPLFQEMFHPMKSEVVCSLISDKNNYIVLRLFLYVAIPTFILIRFAVENFARNEHKTPKKNRLFRVGRRLMLASGFVLALHAIMTAAEVIAKMGYADQLKDSSDLYVFIGIYMFLLTVLPAVFSGSIFSQGDILLTMDSIVMMIITLGYTVGSVIVRFRYDPALARPRTA